MFPAGVAPAAVTLPANVTSFGAVEVAVTVVTVVAAAVVTEAAAESELWARCAAVETYLAVNSCVPGARSLTVSEALPVLALGATGAPTAVAPWKNCTLPTGLAAAAGVTVAAKVAAPPVAGAVA